MILKKCLIKILLQESTSRIIFLNDNFIFHIIILSYFNLPLFHSIYIHTADECPTLIYLQQ